jgi:hypothetical protein
MTFISHIDASHILMYYVPARIFALKPPLDFLALAPVQFLPPLQSLKSGQLPLPHGKLNLEVGLARLGSVGNRHANSPAGSSPA